MGDSTPKAGTSPASPGRASKSASPPAASASPGPADPLGNVGALEADVHDEHDNDADSLHSVVR